MKAKFPTPVKMKGNKTDKRHYSYILINWNNKHTKIYVIFLF